MDMSEIPDSEMKLLLLQDLLHEGQSAVGIWWKIDIHYERRE